MLFYFLLDVLVRKKKWSLFIDSRSSLLVDGKNIPTNLSSLKVIDQYSSYEECVKAAHFNKGAFSGHPYECGYKCEIDLKSKPYGYICEQTWPGYVEIHSDFLAN